MILAGGEATRLPGKLALDAGGIPLLARTYRNLAGGDGDVVLACKATFPAELDALVPAAAIVDRWARRGPLAGLLSAMAVLRTPWVFAAAGDVPNLDRAFVAHLATLRRPGDEAVVPVHDGALEPLAALYERAAFAEAALAVLRSGRGAMRLAIDRVRARFVPMSHAKPFENVNTPDDYERLRRLPLAEHPIGHPRQSEQHQ